MAGNGEPGVVFRLHLDGNRTTREGQGGSNQVGDLQGRVQVGFIPTIQFAGLSHGQRVLIALSQPSEGGGVDVLIP